MSQWGSAKSRRVLAALLSIGWVVKRQAAGSHKILSRSGWPDYVFAFHDSVDLPGDWNWQAIRKERDPKEVYFTKLAAARGVQNDPGGGRKTLGIEAARKYRRVFSRCREDIQVFEKRIEKWCQEKTILSWQTAFNSL